VPLGAAARWLRWKEKKKRRKEEKKNRRIEE
jgi:hypothetical protein